MAKQITVRGVSPELAGRLQKLSRARGESLNATVLHILKQAVGVHERRERLARYVIWDSEDLAEAEQAVRSQRQVDPDLWQ